MKTKKLFALLAAVPLFLASCSLQKAHFLNIDLNKDGKCDICGKVLKEDTSKDEGEDKEGGETTPCTSHVDNNGDGKCDNCGASMSTPCTTHIDSNGDGKCDICGHDMPPVTGQVDVYLVLSSVGLLDGQPGTTVSELNLEYTVKLTANVGDALPGKDRVTHKTGVADFSGWASYDGGGAPTYYTTVPSVHNKILYAQFEINGSTPQPSSETKDITLLTNFGDQNWSVADAKIAAYCWNDSMNLTYVGTKVDDNTFTFKVSVSYTHLLFARMPQSVSTDPLDWSSIWNQTDDMDILSDKSVAQITSWSSGNQGHSTASWIS